jgi:hypothetical protein
MLLMWHSWCAFDRRAVESETSLSSDRLDLLQRFWPLAEKEAQSISGAQRNAEVLREAQPFTVHPISSTSAAATVALPAAAAPTPVPAAAAATASPAETTAQTSTSFSWLEVANAVNNETKHVRLTAQDVKKDLSQVMGGLSVRNTSVRIFFTEEECHYWSFITCCADFPVAHLLQFSRLIRRFLDKEAEPKLLVTGSKVNPDHHLVELYVQLKRAAVSPENAAAVRIAQRDKWPSDETAESAAMRVSKQFKDHLRKQLRDPVAGGFSGKVPPVAASLAESCCDLVADVLLYKALYAMKLHLREKNPVEEMGVDLFSLLEATFNESKLLLKVGFSSSSSSSSSSFSPLSLSHVFIHSCLLYMSSRWFSCSNLVRCLMYSSISLTRPTAPLSSLRNDSNASDPCRNLLQLRMVGRSPKSTPHTWIL